MAARQTCEEKILASWRIKECQLTFDDKTSLLESAVGIVFTLKKNRTVVFSCSKEHFFLAECDVFDLRFLPYSIVLEMASFEDHSVKFTVDIVSSSEVILSSPLLSLNCVKGPDDNPDQFNFPYSLLPAFEEGFFSDMEISSSDNKKFSVHATVLRIGLPELNWSETKFPGEVLAVVLHFAYSHSLPPSMRVSTAERCLQILEGTTGTDLLLDKCRLFLRSSSLTASIAGYVENVHATMEKMISSFDQSQNYVDSSAKVNALWHSLKQGFLESLMIVVNIVQLSCTFVERKNELDSEDRVKTLSFFRSQVPIFASRLYRLVKRFRNVLNGLCPTEKIELANLVAPEVEGFLSTVSAICIELKNILEQIISTQTERHVNEDLKPFQKKRIHTLKKIHDKLTLAVMFVLHKKDTFAELGAASQVRSVSRNMEFVMEEVPLVVLRLEEIMTSLEESFTPVESQLVFTQLSSKLARVISYVRELKDQPNVRALMQQLCDQVQREDFSAALADLGLVDQPSYGVSAAGTEHPRLPPFTQQAGDELRTIGSQCKPPRASHSGLAKKALELLESGQDADLQFELPCDHEGQSQGQGQVLKGHRAIVAARCRWFRRALLSGMREAIDRKISIPDCSAALLRLLLQFIYGGVFDSSEMSVDNLTDLLILADRYEVEDLSQCCQIALSARLDPSNVLCLLSVADQWGASQLQDACMAYVAAHADAIDKDNLEDLVPLLRLQVQSVINNGANCNRRKTYWWISSTDNSDGEKSSSDKESVDLFRELTDEMQAAVEQVERQQREERLELCVSELVEIIGDQVPREELVRLAWAADFDINRAVNFYLSQPLLHESEEEG